VDVLVARSITTLDGLPIEFERLWARRQTVSVGDAHPQGEEVMTIPAAIVGEIERLVSVDELRHALQRSLGESECEEVLSLVRWFTRRYPSPEERLRYVRRAYRRWQQTARPVHSLSPWLHRVHALFADTNRATDHRDRIDRRRGRAIASIPSEGRIFLVRRLMRVGEASIAPLIPRPLVRSRT
jgi:hypothetical protein